MNLPEVLDGARICVCAGSGGVGKTTTSAVIGLGMAARGLRVCVITIDPARRLATALGLEELGNEPRQVEPERLAGAGLTLDGELWAMMLDPKRTFDELIDETAPSPERAAAIKQNPIYEQFSSAVAGSQEFTAVTKLYELVRSGRFDLLVLDTPPTRNAIDFLEAPRRINTFLEGRALQALLRPAGLGARLISAGAAPMLSGLRRVTGSDLIGEIVAFFGLLAPLTAAFTARTRAVEAMLGSASTAFLLICSPQGGSIEEAIWFRRALTADGKAFTGVVVNRFHHGPAGDRDGGGEPPVAELTSRLEGDVDLAERIMRVGTDAARVVASDAAGLRRLEAGLDGEPVLTVPDFDAEVYDIDGLARIHDYLFGTAAERAAQVAALGG